MAVAWELFWTFVDVKVGDLGAARLCDADEANDDDGPIAVAAIEVVAVDDNCVLVDNLRD